MRVVEDTPRRLVVRDSPRVAQALFILALLATAAGVLFEIVRPVSLRCPTGGMCALREWRVTGATERRFPIFAVTGAGVERDGDRCRVVLDVGDQRVPMSSRLWDDEDACDDVSLLLDRAARERALGGLRVDAPDLTVAYVTLVLLGLGVLLVVLLFPTHEAVFDAEAGRVTITRRAPLVRQTDRLPLAEIVAVRRHRGLTARAVFLERAGGGRAAISVGLGREAAAMQRVQAFLDRR